MMNERLNKVLDLVRNELVKGILLNNIGTTCLNSNDTLSKNIDGEIITKKCVRRKDWSYDWIENVRVEDIDSEYFNEDYTRKKL